MNRDQFAKLLATRLYPVLRAEGFRGSGATLRRIAGPVVHVFNLQGSVGGQRCYLNLGAHVLLLPHGEGDAPDPKKIMEYDCLFRDRLEPPVAHPQGWLYGDSEEAAESMAALVVEAWHRQAAPFFARYATYPGDFDRLVNELDADGLHPGRCLDMARLAMHLGFSSRAAAIAQSALPRAPERATGLKSNLRHVIALCERVPDVPEATPRQGP